MKHLFVFSIIAVCFFQPQISAADQGVLDALMNYYQHFQDEKLEAYYAVQDNSRMTPKELKVRKEITRSLWQRFDTLSFDIKDLSVAKDGNFSIAKYTLHASIKGPDATGAMKIVNRKRPYAAILVADQNQWKVSTVTDPETLANVTHNAFRRLVSSGTDISDVLPAAASGDKTASSIKSSPQRHIPEGTPNKTSKSSHTRSRTKSGRQQLTPSSLAAWIDWIESGNEFYVTLDANKVDDSSWTGNWQTDPLGTIKAGETYMLRYANDKYTATGFHEKSRLRETHSASGIQPQDSHFSIWGRTFTFDGKGTVWDQDYGIIGSISTVASSTKPVGKPSSGNTPPKHTASTSKKTIEPAQELMNIALKRPTLVSSYSRYSKRKDVAKDGNGAVDGDRSQGMYGFHTKKEQSPWWQVDLGEGAVVHKLVIYNRACCADRAKSLLVLVSDDGVKWQQVYDNGGKTFSKLEVPLKLISTRYLRLQLTAMNWFHLTEVQVWGTR